MSRSRNRAQNPPAQKVARARTDGANPCSKHKDARTRKERLGNLSKGVFERRTSTGRGLFTFLSSGFAQIFSQIVSTSVKKLSNTHFIASRHIKREKSSLPVDVRRSKALYFLWASRAVVFLAATFRVLTQTAVTETILGRALLVLMHFLLFQRHLSYLRSRAQLFEGRLASNPGFFFLCCKAFSGIIFSVIFRASSHQLVDKKN